MNLQKIKQFDRGFVFKTYENTHKQFEQIFNDFKNIDLSKIKNVDNILVCGMGGSALGAHFVRSVFKDINIPVIISHEYNLPSWVNKKTLIIISSFSGTTEEPMNSFKEAKKRKLKVFCVGSTSFDPGNVPQYLFDAKYNYAKNPRFAVGYSIASFISLFSKLEILKCNISKLTREIKAFHKGKQIAEKIAKNITGKAPVIIASEHLTGNAHIFQNQVNETGKNFASYFTIPEICHHQFEGLSNPVNLNKNIIYVLLESNLYHKRNQKRYEIMKEILNKKKIKFIEIKSKYKNAFEEAMYILGVSSYASFYLAYYNNIDPQPNPYVDYLKNRMKPIR